MAFVTLRDRFITSKLRQLIPGRTDTQMVREACSRYAYIVQNIDDPDKLMTLIEFWRSEGAGTDADVGTDPADREQTRS